MDFTFRNFEVGDFEPVIDLWVKAGLKLSRTDSREGLAKKLERDADLFFVAEHGTRIVGVVMGCYDGRRGFINHLAVDPEFQGHHLGTRLIDELESRLREKNCEKVNLLVASSNSTVAGFYEKLGYNTDELIFMEKWLT